LNPSTRNAGRPQDGETRPSGAARIIPPGLDAVLVLLRHGETEAIVARQFQGQMETPLSEAGIAQVGRAGRLLAFRDGAPVLPIPATAPRFLIHSPLGRTRHSAEIAAEAMARAGIAVPPLRPVAGFAEIAQGEWEGLTDTEITARFGDSLGSWRRWPTLAYAPGGENLGQVFERVQGALSKLLTELARDGEPGTMDRHQVLGYGDDATDERPWGLIVGHGGSFRVAVCSLLDLSPDHFWNVDFALASISVVEIRAGRAVLRALNLEAPADTTNSGTPDRNPSPHADRDASGAL
jgi:broad specificity phosphatase PhoE